MLKGHSMKSITPRLGIPLFFFVGLFMLFVLGLLSLQPGLSIAYLCLIPWVGIWVGRASVTARQRSS